MSRAEAGRAGGLATFGRHGREHMQAIGCSGYHATAYRHFGGDYALMHTYLTAHAAAANRARAAKRRLEEEGVIVLEPYHNDTPPASPAVVALTAA